MFSAVACGPDVTIVREGLPPAIPVEFCCLGWQESLVLLAHLVEADNLDIAWPARQCGASMDWPSAFR